TDCATELLKGESGAKYSPLEVAQWLEGLAQKADPVPVGTRAMPEEQRIAYRRLYVDVRIQNCLGRFFARKFRSGVLYAIHEQSGSRYALQSSLSEYRAARNVWAELIKETNGVYVPDLTFGPRPYQRGNWSDRLAAIDADIAEMTKRVEATSPHEEI